MDTIAIASDHAGLVLKSVFLKLSLPWLDLGTQGTDSVDYPDFADKVVQTLKAGTASRGVLICGSGIGMSIAANRHEGMRAALCTCATMATFARQHNDANILVLGARIIGEATALECLEAFLSASFAGGRHQDRLHKIDRV